MKNIYVYDKGRYFYPYLRKAFSKEYNVFRLNNVELMKAENFRPSDIGIFSANDDFEIIAFFRFKECFGEKIIVCHDKKKFQEVYNKKFKLECFDISIPKVNFYNPLKMKIDILFRK